MNQWIKKKMSDIALKTMNVLYSLFGATTELRKQFIWEYVVSFWRMIFYYLVIYGALLCGCSAVTDTSLIEWRCVAIAGLFIPFIFVYSMLFELSQYKFYKNRLKKEDKPFQQYFTRTGQYFPIGPAVIIFSVLTVIAFIACINNSFFPLRYFPILILLNFALAGLLFASKYHQLNTLRSSVGGEPGSLFGLSTFWVMVMLSLSGLVFIAIQGFGARTAEDRDDYKWVLIVTGSILLLIIILIYLGKRLSEKKKASDIFFYERPSIRETLLLLSILWLPFVTGIYSSYFVNNVRFGLLEFVGILFSTPRYFFVLLATSGLWLILEQMRYLGRYDESYHARKVREVEVPEIIKQIQSELEEQRQSGKINEQDFIREHAKIQGNKGAIIETKLNERFQKSVRKYMMMFIFILSFYTLLFFFGEFDPTLNVVITPFVFLLIGFTLATLTSFEKMGFEEGQKYRISFTRARLLIGTKLFGFIIFITILNYAYKEYQTNPAFINSQNNLVNTRDAQIILPYGNPLLKAFVLARETDNYDLKRKFLLSFKDSSMAQSKIKGDSSALLKSIRLSERGWRLLQKDEMLFHGIPALGNVDTLVSQHMAMLTSRSNSQESLVIFILGAFITIVVGLVLSSFVLSDKPNFLSRGILVGVITQAAVVGFVTWLYFIPVNIDQIHQSFSSFGIDFLIALKYQDRTVAIGITYVILALGLLVVVAINKHFRNAS